MVMDAIYTVSFPGSSSIVAPLTLNGFEVEVVAIILVACSQVLYEVWNLRGVQRPECKLAYVVSPTLFASSSSSETNSEWKGGWGGGVLIDSRSGRNHLCRLRQSRHSPRFYVVGLCISSDHHNSCPRRLPLAS